jgi:hypothetical protein
MGSITRSFANNITTSGVLLPASLNNNSIANVTAYNAAVATGNMVLLSSQTASNSASISFTTGIDSTYKEYQFWFINIGARTNEAEFGFLTSTDGGSNYGNTVTNTTFRAYHTEDGSQSGLDYVTSFDLAQSTGLNNLSLNQGNNADDSCCGTLSLFNPASTTYVKHFIAICGNSHDTVTPLEVNNYLAGYVNTTSAVNAIQFKMSSGNMDGTILMYGIV